MNLAPYREAILRACATAPQTRSQLREACGGRKGIGTQRFHGLVQTMVESGCIVHAGQIPNPLKGQGHNNVPLVYVYRTSPEQSC